MNPNQKSFLAQKRRSLWAGEVLRVHLLLSAARVRAKKLLLKAVSPSGECSWQYFGKMTKGRKCSRKLVATEFRIGGVFSVFVNFERVIST